ncbi:unnamed protein product [Rangifer tarandus platyrhynchus]|uniref:Uncharacterized protein n=1 Tax=Rangifer tarandus platyrhynchus TaxID=3082113 RepID=A0ABN8ZCW2_RANTA|nr:unnamed protein product [Rangifer tarandus platyrhynchus]CAI9689166.1 unnamed protein product [Rangifer tarandus platyrhynchus]
MSAIFTGNSTVHNISYNSPVRRWQFTAEDRDEASGGQPGALGVVLPLSSQALARGSSCDCRATERHPPGLFQQAALSGHSSSSIQHRTSVTPSAWDIQSRPCSYQWTISNGSSRPGLRSAVGGSLGNHLDCESGKEGLKKKKKSAVRTCAPRPSVRALYRPALRKPVALRVPHHRRCILEATSTSPQTVYSRTTAWTPHT